MPIEVGVHIVVVGITIYIVVMKRYQRMIPPFSMSSKDLQTLAFIPRLIDANVASLKIEGRMKSIHYIATVVRSYRLLMDEY